MACQSAPDIAAETGAETTLDRLAGDWWIYQLRRGHRYATDDLLVAWRALSARPDARRVLDLGAGVGSVGLLTLLGLCQEARLVSVEVQAQSAALLRRTVARNGLQGRVTVQEADLRAPDAFSGSYDLVVANPPFLPPGSATPSPVPQRAGARLELRGDVYDYARAAARALAPEGRLVLCHAIGDPRPPEALARAGLCLLERQELIFRAGRPSGLALYTAGWSGERRAAPTLAVRDASGAWTPTWDAVRVALKIR